MRLRPYVRRLKGMDLPKQYVNFIGSRSMLEHTLGRAESLIPAQRLFTVVARNHLGFAEARRQLSSRPRGTVVVQPANRDTLPGLLLPLLHLRRLHPDSAVAVFPSDHYVLEEERFMRWVREAFRAVEQDPGRIVLLGIEPREAETEYGYILPDRLQPAFSAEMGRVRRFVEKPGPALAEQLIRQGAFWNTLVLVFQTSAFLAIVEKIVPAILPWCLRIEEALDSLQAPGAIDEAYRRAAPLNLSKDLLQNLASDEPGCLSVLAARGVTWSDWGSEDRIWAACPGAAWNSRRKACQASRSRAS